MAKRGGGSSDFNMAEEIRNLLANDKNLTGRDVVNQLRQKFPKQQINDSSCQVAFANARKKMGISTVRKKRPVGNAGKKSTRTWSTAPKSSGNAASAADNATPSIDRLLAAKQLLQQCGGDASLAAAAVKQVASLQMQ